MNNKPLLRFSLILTVLATFAVAGRAYASVIPVSATPDSSIAFLGGAEWPVYVLDHQFDILASPSYHDLAWDLAIDLQPQGGGTIVVHQQFRLYPDGWILGGTGVGVLETYSCTGDSSECSLFDDLLRQNMTYSLSTTVELGYWLGVSFPAVELAPSLPAQWFTQDIVVSGVPIPAAGWLLGSACLGLVGVARSRHRAVRV